MQVTPRQVGASLRGPYLLGVELASMLLLLGLVGALHLAYRPGPAKGGDGKGVEP
jgi:NADH-quinone oxidoreductase subunit J